MQILAFFEKKYKNIKKAAAQGYRAAALSCVVCICMEIILPGEDGRGEMNDLF